MIRLIPIKQYGGLRLEPKPHVAAMQINNYSDEALNCFGTYTPLLVILLPYISGTMPDEVQQLAITLEELGASVARPKSGEAPWPSRSPRFDGEFLDALFGAMAESIESAFPAPPQDDQDTIIACELLRGLAAHNKMGRNNHSYEDDMWKARGNALGPGGRDRIASWLLREGILARKKNNSAGGTGWVYWIGNVAKTKELCPELGAYFK